MTFCSSGTTSWATVIAEALDVLGAVADAIHPHIGQLAVVVEAHHLSLLVQVS